MKIYFVLFISTLFFSSILQSQSLCIKVEEGLYFPSLTHKNGDTPNCFFMEYKADCPDIGVEYKNKSGLLLSATVGYQKDWFNFSEINKVYTYGGAMAIGKIYKSVPLIFSSGYACRIGKSHFHFNALAGIGFGIVHSDEVKHHFAFDEWLTVTDQQGQDHLDSQHVFISVVDEPTKKIIPQARVSVALQYDIKRFFVRSFFEMRSSLSKYEEIDYHSERSSMYYQFSQTVDGKFSVRTGYIGIGIGVGWYLGLRYNKESGNY